MYVCMHVSVYVRCIIYTCFSLKLFSNKMNPKGKQYTSVTKKVHRLGIICLKLKLFQKIIPSWNRSLQTLFPLLVTKNERKWDKCHSVWDFHCQLQSSTLIKELHITGNAHCHITTKMSLAKSGLIGPWLLHVEKAIREGKSL